MFKLFLLNNNNIISGQVIYFEKFTICNMFTISLYARMNNIFFNILINCERHCLRVPLEIRLQAATTAIDTFFYNYFCKSMGYEKYLKNSLV